MLVDFGIKLICEGVQPYEKGSLQSNDGIELITDDLTRLTEDIVTSTRPGKAQDGMLGRPPSKDEESLRV